MLAPTTGIRYQFLVQYEWNNGKAAENLRKHRVDFADAIAALEDTNRLEEIDTRFDYGEERIQVIGMARGHVLVVVVTLIDEETCRIISRPQATRHKQDRNYARDPGNWETPTPPPTPLGPIQPHSRTRAPRLPHV